jgi:hypothetical protein
MENSIKTVVWDGGGRKEIYNHKQTEGFATGINLKPLENFTQEREYEILEEKTAKEILGGMIYKVKDDKGNTRHVSDRYFHTKEAVLCFDHGETDWKDALSPETVARLCQNIPELKEEVTKDFDKCGAIEEMPVPECCTRKPTVRGLKEEYESNIYLNKLAGTWKKKTSSKRQARPIEDVRQVKSSLEEELEDLREGCLDMVDRIDSMITAVEAVRKFA